MTPAVGNIVHYFFKENPYKPWAALIVESVDGYLYLHIFARHLKPTSNWTKAEPNAGFEMDGGWWSWPNEAP